MESVVGRGTLLAGRYRTLQPLPSDLPGASGWEATDQILDRPVRVTVLHTGQVAQALDAARRAALVTDPRLIRVLDVGDHDGVAYMVTEQVTGPSLADLVARGPVPADQARAIVGEAASALEAARRRGVHHLTLRPSVLHLTPDDRVLVTGLAVDAALLGLDTSDAAAATRADTVGLVGLLYAALTGRWPRSVTASADAATTQLEAAPVLEGAPVPPAELASGVPNDLDTLCAVTLGVHDDGPRTPAELVEELEPWGNIRATDLFAGTEVPPVAPLSAPAPPVPVAEVPPTPARVQRTSVRSVLTGGSSAVSSRPGTPPPAVPSRVSSITGPAVHVGPAGGGAAAGETAAAAAAGAAGVAGAAAASDTPTAPLPASPPAPAAPALSVPAAAPPTASPAPVGPPAPAGPPAAETVAAEPAAAPPEAAGPATASSSSPGDDAPTTPFPVTDGPGPGPTSGMRPTAPSRPTRPARTTPPTAPAATAAPPAGTAPPAAAAAATVDAPEDAPTDAVPAGAPPSGTTAGAPPGTGDRSPLLGSLGARASSIDVAAARESIAAHRFDPTRLVLLLVSLVIVVGLFIAYGALTRPVELSAGSPEPATATEPAPEPTADQPAEEEPPAEPQPEAPPVVPTIAAAAQLDPPPDGDGNEHPEAVPLGIDGDPSTAWYTRTYSTPQFGGLKSGLGYAVTLAEPATVSSVTLQVQGTGGRVELRATDPATPTDGPVLAESTLGPETVLTLSEPTEAQDLVLWFTELPQTADGSNRVELAEVTVS